MTHNLTIYTLYYNVYFENGKQFHCFQYYTDKNLTARLVVILKEPLLLTANYSH